MLQTPGSRPEEHDLGLACSRPAGSSALSQARRRDPCLAAVWTYRQSPGIWFLSGSMEFTFGISMMLGGALSCP